MIAESLPTPAFDHTLHILAPIETGGKVLWFAYLDEPSRWHRSFPSCDQLLTAAADVVRRQLRFERMLGTESRPPNRSCGTPLPVPDVPPRWPVRIVVDAGEDEWRIEVQDESAWATSGTNLPELFEKLGRRIAGHPAQPYALPAPAPLSLVRSVAQDTPFARLVQESLAEIETRLAEQHEVLSRTQSTIDALQRERAALRAALSAYSTKTRQVRGTRRGRA